MPFDVIKALGLVQTAHGFFQHPTGDLIRLMAEQLDFAAKEIGGYNQKIIDAQTAQRIAEKRAEDEQNNLRSGHAAVRAEAERLVAEEDRLKLVVDTIKQIANGAKNPKKMATEAVQSSGLNKPDSEGEPET